MKARLAKALRHTSTSIDPTSGELKELPGKFYDLAKRISHRDFCTVYIALMRHPEISSEWVLRGRGKMLVSDDLHLMEIEEQNAKILDLQKQLEYEKGKNKYLEINLAEVTANVPKRGRSRPRRGG